MEEQETSEVGLVGDAEEHKGLFNLYPIQCCDTWNILLYIYFSSCLCSEVINYFLVYPKTLYYWCDITYILRIYFPLRRENRKRPLDSSK